MDGTDSMHITVLGFITIKAYRQGINVSTASANSNVDLSF
jgi:hypothetical protein